MKKKFCFLAMFLTVLYFGLNFSGCTTSPGMGFAGSTNVKTGNLPKQQIGIISPPKYTVAGPVTLEKKWVGIFGFSTSGIGRIPPVDLYLWQSGGVNYIDLLNEAKYQYRDVDAVIDINVDYSGSHYFYIYAQRKVIVTGIAIKYSREEVGNYPNEKSTDKLYIISDKLEEK